MTFMKPLPERGMLSLFKSIFKIQIAYWRPA